MDKREIKFRGIANCDVEETTVKEGSMIFGQVVFDGDTPFIVGPVIESCEEYIALEHWCPIRPETLGQYTGLKDKNGVEIYEGDIIRIPKYKTKFATAKVHEIGAYGVFVHYLSGYSGGGFWAGIGRKDEIEVIGNVFENPELLESPTQE